MADIKFSSCWVDDDPTVVTETLDGTTFTMRGITIGEHSQIMVDCRSRDPEPVRDIDPEFIRVYAEALGKTVAELSDEERRTAEATATRVQTSVQVDVNRLMILTVAAALGAYQKFHTEGWAKADGSPIDRPVTVDNVGRLRKEILVALYNRHDEFFRRK